MIWTIVASKDHKADCFGNPHCVKTAAEGIRNFATVVRDPKTIFNQHPGDFALFEIGHFNDHSGVVEPHLVPKFLCSASEHLTEV